MYPRALSWNSGARSLFNVDADAPISCNGVGLAAGELPGTVRAELGEGPPWHGGGPNRAHHRNWTVLWMLCRSKETVEILQEYYTTCRGIDTQGQGLSTVLVTLLRLCFASARLHLRKCCDAVDCMLAVRLVEESRRFQHHISVLEVDDLIQAPQADASGDENTFDGYLEGLRCKYASQTCAPQLHEE